jgi:hypothetical protein
VIGWEPTINVLVVRIAWPLFKVPVPRIVAPSRNVIVPVTPAGTVAVKVTDWLTIEGLRDEAMAIVGVTFPTVTTVAPEVTGLLFVSPDVVAVMGSVPIGKDGTVIVAIPPTMGAVPIGVVPLENVTVPVTPGGTVSVIVTGVLGGGLEGETTGGGMTGVALLTIWVRGADVDGLLLVSPP